MLYSSTYNRDAKISWLAKSTAKPSWWHVSIISYVYLSCNHYGNVKIWVLNTLFNIANSNVYYAVAPKYAIIWKCEEFWVLRLFLEHTSTCNSLKLNLLPRFIHSQERPLACQIKNTRIDITTAAFNRFTLKGY